MRVQFEDDYPTVISSGHGFGVDIGELPPVRARQASDGSVVDIENVTEFFIDTHGRKHIEQLDAGWQAMTCAWDAALLNDGAAWRVVNDQDQLEQAKARGKRRLARDAEARRQEVITPGDGKAAIYSLKRDEAARWQAAVDAAQAPVAADYPWIDARATRLGITAQAVADEWNAKAAAYEALGIQIEGAYEAGVEAIDALTDGATADADVAAIIDAVAWPAS